MRSRPSFLRYATNKIVIGIKLYYVLTMYQINSIRFYSLLGIPVLKSFNFASLCLNAGRGFIHEEIVSCNFEHHRTLR